jgi:uncharacterized protein
MVISTPSEQAQDGPVPSGDGADHGYGLPHHEIRGRSMAQAHAFLDLLTAKDMTGWANLWADDAVQDMPFSPDGFPRQVDGKENLLKHYAKLPTNTGRMEFLDRILHPMADPHVVLMEYRGEIEIRATGRRYDNCYASLFVFDCSGRIQLLREYCNPVVLTEACGAF